MYTPLVGGNFERDSVADEEKIDVCTCVPKRSAVSMMVEYEHSVRRSGGMVLVLR